MKKFTNFKKCIPCLLSMLVVIGVAGCGEKKIEMGNAGNAVDITQIEEDADPNAIYLRIDFQNQLGFEISTIEASVPEADKWGSSLIDENIAVDGSGLCMFALNPDVLAWDFKITGSDGKSVIITNVDFSSESATGTVCTLINKDGAYSYTLSGSEAIKNRAKETPKEQSAEDIQLEEEAAENQAEETYESLENADAENEEE